jgi:hypothetical protein
MFSIAVLYIANRLGANQASGDCVERIARVHMLRGKCQECRVYYTTDTGSVRLRHGCGPWRLQRRQSARG